MTDLGESGLRRWFWIALGATTTVRVAMAALVPFLPDEAYFLYWGRDPGYGFYEHPPVLLWMVAGLSRLSDAPWVLRLPVIVVPVVVAVVAVRLLRSDDARKAYAAGIVLVLAPMASLFFPLTTDVPLVLFSFLSIAAFHLALRRPSPWLFAVAGALLGLALLTKYLAVLLAAAYAAFAVLSPPRERRWRGVAVAALCALPFVLVNLVWNYEHCWSNVVFSLYSRDAAVAWSGGAVLEFAGLALYGFTPAAALLAVAAWPRRRGLWRSAPARLVLLATVVPFVAIAAVSGMARVTAPFLLPLIPALVVALAPAVSTAQLTRAARLSCVVLALHVPALAAFLWFIAGAARDSWPRAYEDFTLWKDRDAVLARLDAFRPEFELAASRGSDGSLLAYGQARRGVPDARVLVFGLDGPTYRQHDAVHDYAALARRNVLVLERSARRGALEPFFDSVEYRDLVVEGAPYHLALGRGFRYEPYRDRVLATIRDRYYRIPAFLPQGRCEFCSRYFGPTCPTR